MMRSAILLALLLPAVADNVSPVQKVIELLQENKAKVAADLAAEADEMEQYSAFCDDTLSEKGYAIKTAGSKIADLTAVIADGEAQIASLADEISTLGTQLAEKERQLVAASTERSAAKTEFEGVEKELMTAVDQLTRAVVIIKREMSFVQTKKGQRPGHKDLKLALQAISKMIDAAWVTSGNKRNLKAFLQSQAKAGEDDDLSISQPQATVTAYESKSGGIVEEIEEMKQKAEETLSDARQTEMKENHNYNMIAQSLNDAISLLKEKLSDAKSSKAASTEENGKAKAELTETEKSKAADETYVATLTQDCSATHLQWEERQASAKGEMAAIDKAKEILSEGVKVFLQSSDKKASKNTKKNDGDDDEVEDKQEQVRHRLAEKLKDLSHTFKSYALMEMVSAASSDPFEKVRGLIEEMITKLVNEANEEATQKAFCDEEMGKSKKAQAEKSMTVDKLTSRIDKASTTKAELEMKIKELEGEIAALDKATAEATKIRSEEQATYTKSSADFKLAAESVTKAIGVLKEYYESALIQTSTSKKQGQPDFGGAKSDAAHSIISILEMSAENFTKMLMEIETSETEAVADFKKLSDESKLSKATKQAEVKGSLSEIKSLDVALKNSGEDKDMTSKELDAVMSYMEKLKPQCETKAMSYAEKKARREAEIEGLKEALGILDGSAVLMQTRAQLRGVRKH
jgi:chromosome segregation ATPase